MHEACPKVGIAASPRRACQDDGRMGVRSGARASAGWGKRPPLRRPCPTPAKGLSRCLRDPLRESLLSGARPLRAAFIVGLRGAGDHETLAQFP